MGLQFCSSLCAQLLQKSQGGRPIPRPDKDPQPRSSPEATDKGSDRGARKTGPGRCAQESAGSETPIAFCQGREKPLVEPSKKIGREIDKQTEIITEAELARGRYRDELAEVHLKLQKLPVEETRKKTSKNICRCAAC